ncbi:hypothetical protein AMTRI_Chr08g202590 [Amborella trichopoda]
MGTVFGKIGVETPRFKVLYTASEFEVREYEPNIVAEVTYDPTQMGGDPDAGFQVLANYIGALGNPQNTRPERIAMTAPVITHTSNPENATKVPVEEHDGDQNGKPEKIAMTAPVITQKSSLGNKSEKIEMTAPVITQKVSTAKMTEIPQEKKSGQREELVTMQFVLPSKYSLISKVPRPTDSKVVIREVPGKKYGVIRFNGVADDKLVKEKVEKLKGGLEGAGYKIIGDWLLARYNPPWTLPIFRTNEVMLPVE